MNKSLLLSAALAAVLLPAPLMVAHAQTQSGGVDAPKANTRAARKAQGAATKQEVLFPNSKRVEPPQTGDKSLVKQLDKMVALQGEQKADEAIAVADQVIADPKATAFDRGFANYVAANAWLDKDTASYTNAITYLNKAIGENSLSNNAQFQMMLQLSNMLKNEERYPESLAMVDRYLTESGSDNPKAFASKADTLYRMGRYADSLDIVKKALATGQGDDSLTKLLVANYQELNRPGDAAKTLEDMLAKKPGDKQLMLALASSYQQADQDAKAGEVFDRMRAGGMLTESRDYESGYRLLANIPGREKDAVAFINEGLQKGILTPDYNVYSALGTIHYNADQIPQAIEAWSKAAPLAKDGEMYLNLGKLQVGEEKYADGKVSGQQALAKGVKKKGEAWLVVARAEFGLGNKPAVLAAYREAAKYPETKKQAETALRQAAGQ